MSEACPAVNCVLVSCSLPKGHPGDHKVETNLSSSWTTQTTTVNSPTPASAKADTSTTPAATSPDYSETYT